MQLIGALLAEDYDAIYDGVFDTEGAVERLADLADGGRVLELGRGYRPNCLAACRPRTGGIGNRRLTADPRSPLGQPGSARVETACGDFAQTRVEGQFALDDPSTAAEVHPVGRSSVAVCEV
jgi:hypothetical protein